MVLSFDKWTVFWFLSFFRGVKQVDLLSPTLFIIIVQVLARDPNNLNEDTGYRLMGCPSGVQKSITYLIQMTQFCYPYSIRRMMKILRDYENVSRQMINLENILVCLCDNVPIVIGNKTKRLIGVFPFHLSRVSNGRKNKSYFEEVLKKVLKRLSLWQVCFDCSCITNYASILIISYESS